MIWVRRIIIPAEWNEVQDQFESVFVKLGCPGQLMLVATISRIFITKPTMIAAGP